MNYKMMGRFVSQILFVEAFFMIPALLVSLGYREQVASQAFLVTIGLIIAISCIL